MTSNEYKNVSSSIVREPADLGRLLRAQRRQLALTQAHAASLAGISTRLWSECETGQREGVSLDVIIRMLQVVGLDLYVLPRVARAR
jgi:transcriptional regulator with XRE-family HTH domain